MFAKCVADVNVLFYAWPRLLVLDQKRAVAFHAVVDANGVDQHHFMNQNLVFKTVLLNINPICIPLSTWSFHCTHRWSLYVFDLDDRSKPLIHANLVKNRSVPTRAYGHGNSNYMKQGSVAMVTQFKTVDEVKVPIMKLQYVN